MASWKVWGHVPGRLKHRRLCQATCPWLRQFSRLWWWLSRPMYLSLLQLSNCLCLLQLSSCPCPIPCCLWPPLWPLNPPKTFLWHPNCPLPIPLLWHLSHPWLPQPFYLVARLGKPPVWLCLPTAGARIVAARSWMGEWCRRGGGCIAATQITLAFSGLTYPPEEVGKRVMWGLAIEPALEGPPLVPLGEAP